MPLWTVRSDLAPSEPRPRAVPHLWRWAEVFPLAERAGELVPVGRGGERRAIAWPTPACREPYATPTLWAAVQYLGPGEDAPAHRHTQTAFRFVLEGEGVWTDRRRRPGRDAPRRPAAHPGWPFHEHHNTTDAPMAWLDGLDIPLVAQLDAGLLRVRPGRGERPVDPDALAATSGCGATPGCARSARRSPARPRR